VEEPGNLVLFYRDFPYSDGLVRLGRLDPGAADVLAGLDDDTTVTIAFVVVFEGPPELEVDEVVIEAADGSRLDDPTTC
jgi:hypothetical protein